MSSFSFFSIFIRINENQNMGLVSWGFIISMRILSNLDMRIMFHVFYVSKQISQGDRYSFYISFLHMWFIYIYNFIKKEKRKKEYTYANSLTDIDYICKCCKQITPCLCKRDSFCAMLLCLILNKRPLKIQDFKWFFLINKEFIGN